jgi:hypothetical protein
MLLARKQVGVGDRALYTIDLSQWLLAIEDLDTVSVQVYPDTTPAAVATAEKLTDSLIGVSFTGGALGETYSVAVTYTTTVSQDGLGQPIGTLLRIQNDCIEITVALPCEI